MSIVHDHEVKPYERDALYHHAFCQAAGLALLRADELVGAAEMLAVYDPGPADTIAGTGMALRMWGSDRPAAVLSCPWRPRKTTQADARQLGTTWSTPCRPIVFAWPVLDGQQASELTRAEQYGHEKDVASQLLATLTTGLAGFSANADVTVRRVKNTLRAGAFGVFERIEDAEAAALALVGMLAAPLVGLRVICDLGLVLDRRGVIDVSRLNRLRAAEPNDDTPLNVALATEAFAANARLRSIGSKRYQSAGTLDRSDDPFARGIPAPSLRFYRLS